MCGSFCLYDIFLNNVNCCAKTKNKHGWYHSQGLYRGRYRKWEGALCSSKYAFIFDKSCSGYIQLFQIPSGLTCLPWWTITENVSQTSPISPKLFSYWIFYHSHRNATRTTFITVFISNSKIHLRANGQTKYFQVLAFAIHHVSFLYPEHFLMSRWQCLFPHLYY